MFAHLNLISKLAKRSIFRNTRRTFLTILLIGCGLTALLFTDAFVKGTVHSMVKITTETFLGDGQLHHKQFREANDIDYVIENHQQQYQTLSQHPDISHFSARVLSGAMLASSQNVASALVYGIDAQREANVSKVKQSLTQGQYLTGKAQEIMLGESLADLLEVSLGDRLVVTVSQANGGELSQELFRVSGLFSFNDRNMDNGIAFVNLSKGQQILGVDKVDGVHEIAFRLHEKSLADSMQAPLWKSLSSDNIEALSWRELFPQISSVMGMANYSTLIVSVIMYILVTLGLINTMFMSIYERQNEFGILLAIGTRPKHLFWQILSEGFFIGVLSAATGLLLGSVISYWLSITGISYGESMEMSGITLNDPIYLIIDPFVFAQLSLAIIVITVLACIYPAIHAAKLQPSNAMRKTL